MSAGRWSYIRFIQALVFFFGGIWLAGCNQLERSPIPETVSPSVSPQSPPTSAFHGFTLPDWEELELPHGCQFERLSRDSQWLTYYCPRLQQSDEGQLARISAGQLSRPMSLDHLGRLGFLPDSSGLIIKQQDESLWIIAFSDLAKHPYLSDTFHVSSTLWLEGGVWSPDYSSVAIVDAWANVFIITPERESLKQIVKAPTQNGAQFSWSPDSQEIAYIEGFPTVGDGVTAARIVNVESGESRTLFQDKNAKSGASWSPDGKWIAVRAEELGGNKTILWLLDPLGKSSLKFEYDWAGADLQDGSRDLIWSPDGTKIALRSSHGDSVMRVIEIPSGKIIFQTAEYAEPLGWSTDSLHLLSLTYDLKNERDVLRWIQVLP